jgi:hypothetical protein
VGEQVVGGRRQRLVAAEEPLDHITGGGVDWFQGQLPRPALLLEHDHAVGRERQRPDEGDVGVEQAVVSILCSSCWVGVGVNSSSASDRSARRSWRRP